MLTFDIPRNPFFLRHTFDLTGIHLDIYLAWRDATAIEREKAPSDDDLAKCYMLRAGLYSLFARIAFIIGGDAWSQEVGVEIRRFYGEAFMEYMKEMTNA